MLTFHKLALSAQCAHVGTHFTTPVDILIWTEHPKSKPEVIHDWETPANGSPACPLAVPTRHLQARLCHQRQGFFHFYFTEVFL